MSAPVLRPEPMPAGERVRVGVVGTGVISAQYFESFRRLPEVELVGVADLDAARAAAVAAEQGVAALTVAGLLADPGIDTVLNLTIPAAHAEVCTAALESGKHVYVEKPLALTVADGRALVDLAGRSGRYLGAAPDTVLGTGIQTARAVLDAGEIGTPVAASAFWSAPGHERWHPQPDFYYRPGGGPLFDMGPYYLTSLVTLLGPVESVSAAASRSDRVRTIATGPRAGERLEVDVATHVSAVLRHASGVISTITTSFELWASRQPFIEVHGTGGSMQLPDPNHFSGDVEVFRAGSDGWVTHPVRAGYVDAGRGYGLADFALTRRAGQEARASGALALHVLDIMASIVDAAETLAVVRLTTTVERPAAVPLTQLGAG